MNVIVMSQLQLFFIVMSQLQLFFIVMSQMWLWCQNVISVQIERLNFNC